MELGAKVPSMLFFTVCFFAHIRMQFSARALRCQLSFRECHRSLCKSPAPSAPQGTVNESKFNAVRAYPKAAHRQHSQAVSPTLWRCLDIRARPAAQNRDHGRDRITLRAFCATQVSAAARVRWQRSAGRMSPAIMPLAMRPGMRNSPQMCHRC